MKLAKAMGQGIAIHRYGASSCSPSRSSAGALVEAYRARNARRACLPFGAARSALFILWIFQPLLPESGCRCAALSLAVMAVLVMPSSHQRRMSATTACADNGSLTAWGAGESAPSSGGASARGAVQSVVLASLLAAARVRGVWGGASAVC